MRLQYVGAKASLRDTLYATGAWLPGMPREVADEIGAKLLKHPDVWELASDNQKTSAEPPTKEPAKELDDGKTESGNATIGLSDTKAESNPDAQPDRQALLERCKALGLNPHHKTGTARLAALIAEAEKGA